MDLQAPKDKRRHTRQKGFWSAIAVLPGRIPLNCVVRDLSEGGARLEFQVAVRFPARFQLFIEANDREYDCEVRHSGDYGVGVQFIHSRQCRQHDLICFGRRPTVPTRDVMSDEGTDTDKNADK